MLSKLIKSALVVLGLGFAVVGVGSLVNLSTPAPAKAVSYCWQKLYPGERWLNLTHRYYVKAYSSRDLTELERVGKAWIYYNYGLGWRYYNLSAQEKNVWGVNTSWVAWHPYWKSYSWKIDFQC